MDHLICFSDFFSSAIFAFTTDGAMDFHFDRSTPNLTNEQENFLKEQTGFVFKQVFHMKQIHGRRIVLARSHQKHIPLADASMTQHPGITLTVRTADCVPVFLFDTECQAICLVHAGWRSVLRGIIPQAVLRMRQKFQTDPKKLKVALGPSIQKCCCQVDKIFLKYFPVFVQEKSQKIFLDLPGFIREQFFQEGVFSRNMMLNPCCTACDHRFFSYRREGAQTGRMLSVMMIKDKKKK